MKNEMNEANSELGNLNMATVSQKEGYSRHNENVRMVSDMQRTLTWRNGETRCIVPK
jgi:hypothetical protein